MSHQIQEICSSNIYHGNISKNLNKKILFYGQFYKFLTNCSQLFQISVWCQRKTFSSSKFTMRSKEIKSLTQILIIKISVTNWAKYAVFGSNYKNEQFIKNFLL